VLRQRCQRLGLWGTIWLIQQVINLTRIELRHATSAQGRNNRDKTRKF
jgi:hypothetical protein